MAEKTTIRRKLAKGKNWYKIVAPKAFNENVVGEALSFDPEKIKGRLINVPYSEVAKDLTKQHVTCQLRVTDIVDDTARTELIKYSLSRPFLQRIIRRRSSKVEKVIDMKLKDKDVRVKCLAITAYKANASQRTALRKAIEVEVRKTLAGFDIESLAVALSTNKMQREINKKIKTIFPVRFFEIQKMEILKPKKVGKIKEEAKEVKKKESKHEGKKIKIEKEEPKKAAPKEEAETE